MEVGKKPSLIENLADGVLRIPFEEGWGLVSKSRAGATAGLWEKLTAPISCAASATPTTSTVSGRFLEDVELSEHSRKKLSVAVDYCYDCGRKSSPETVESVAYQAFQNLVERKCHQHEEQFLHFYFDLVSGNRDATVGSKEIELDDKAEDVSSEEKAPPSARKKRRQRDFVDDDEDDDDDDDIEVPNSGEADNNEEVLGYSLVDETITPVWSDDSRGNKVLNVSATILSGASTKKRRCIWPNFNLPKSVFDKLKSHQREFCVWKAGLHMNGECSGGLCADQMGMGKTAQTLAFLGGMMRTGAIKNGLFVVPASVLQHWEREAALWLKWCVPHVSILIINNIKDQKQRRKLLLQALKCTSSKPHIIITSYDWLKINLDKFNHRVHSWDYVILDEGTCKNCQYVGMPENGILTMLLVNFHPLSRLFQDTTSETRRTIEV